MAIGKGAPSSSAGMYKDDVESHADTASTSSAMHLNDIEYPSETTPLTSPVDEGTYADDDLPAYTDIPQLPWSGSGNRDAPISYLIQPELPNSSRSRDEITTSCHYPLYSKDAQALETMIREQAAYPPNLTLRLRGWHTETIRKRDNKTESTEVVDFDIKLSMTHLLVCPNPGHDTNAAPCNLHPDPQNATYPPQDISTPSCKYVQVLGATERGYRGTVIKKRSPANSDPEERNSISSWCQSYVSSPHSLKTFTLKRQILHFDAPTLERLCKELVLRTSYRGHINITFPATQYKITVYSPHIINSWRFNPWIYWPIYLSMLWLLTWPLLIIATKRWEVVTAVFPYRLDPKKNRIPKPLVQSESAFFMDWQESLRRAVISQHQGWIGGVYREETAQIVARGEEDIWVQRRRTGIEGMIDCAVRVSMGGQVGLGWGADS